MTWRILALLAIAVGTFVSCSPADRPSCDQYEEIFALGPKQERDNQFLRQPIETQLEIYVCGWYREPGPRYLADYIADRGEQAIPLVLARLKSEHREFSQQALLYIFVRMGEKGYLRGRSDLLEEIKPIIAGIKHQYTRQKTQEYLDQIEKNTR